MRPRPSLSAAFLASALGLAACTVGPDYRRPEATVPPAFRGIDPGAPAEPGSLGDVFWWRIFEDETLQSLIRTALLENYDLRVAVARILDARSQLVISRSYQFPSLDASGQAIYQRVEGNRPPLVFEEAFFPQAAANLSFELDFWGRYRRATEAARANLLASEEAHHVVVSNLVADVATAYFQLRALDLSLEIARRTLGVRQDSLRLVTLRQEGGVVSMMDVRQAESLVATAARDIPDFERLIEQTENRIATLLGRLPGPVTRGRSLAQQVSLPTLPPGVPAALLERRPDIRLAEQRVVAANAQIGVAKADFFPRVNLLGTIGVGGGTQNNVSFGPLGLFGVGPTVSLPIFNAGRIQAGVESAQARYLEAGVRYQQTVQQALREVSDALVEYRKRQDIRREQENLTGALRDASRLSNLRYDGGVTSYLEVLDSERQLFSAEIDLATARQNELTSVVQLYRALGGGWTQ